MPRQLVIGSSNREASDLLFSHPAFPDQKGNITVCGMTLEAF